MRDRARAALCALLCLLPLFAGLAAATRVQAAAAAVSRAECVLEVTSRRILHSRNAETPLPVASTTKIVTAVIIIEDCDLSAPVVIPKQAEGVEGSSAYLRAGDTYTAEELLYGLMLRSGNDCAEALALFYSGSIQAFARVMNERAAKLGARDSHFVNPHGLPDKRHKTSARDLALIAAHALENETFRTIVSTKYYAPRNWQNKNKMLDRYEGATGVKTGFTLDAGRCLVTSAEREGMRLVSVVLNSPQMYERTEELLDAAFAGYDMEELCRQGDTFGGAEVRCGFCYPLRREEREKIRTEWTLLSPLPVRKGEFAGQMRIFLENDLLFSQNLYIV